MLPWSLLEATLGVTILLLHYEVGGTRMEKESIYFQLYVFASLNGKFDFLYL